MQIVSIRQLAALLLLVSLCLMRLQAQQLISSERKGAFTRAELNAQFGPFFENGITLYKIRYTTPDLRGVTDTASGLLIVPDLRGVSMPLHCSLHGTSDSRSDVPSNLRGGYELGAVFGGLGYVTAMPDYLGLGDSRGFHPYVHAASQASASLDMLLAVGQFAAQNNIPLNDQLFITGYSQGGHAGMALHREIEQNQRERFTVTAASHMSGPYSISGVMRDLIISDREYFFPAYVPFTLLSYREVYGIFNELEEVFKPAYANLIKQYFNGTFTLSTLNATLISLLRQNTGASIARNMFQDSVFNAILNDPNHPFNVALRDNDVFDWAPQAPTRLFYCTADDQVPFRNSIVADSVMRLRGARDVRAVDVNPTADHGGCVFPAVLNTVAFFGQYRRITSSIADAPILPEVRVYPNPVRESVFIDKAPEGAILQIYDLAGRLRLERVLLRQNAPVLLNGLEPGLYVATIVARQGRWTGKVAVQP